ncbi:MAG: esterase family protein, partial [Rhodothermia bacterium]|nr:esterase family protein [Rhodothermia bacterium]
MGGLISLYGFCEYPSTFGKAVCMSTSWTVAGKPILDYIKRAVPPPSGRRIYFDYGSEAQIGAYEKLQHEADRVFYRKGYRRDIHFMVQRFPGDPHSEEAWRGRVEVPLRFVLDTPA